MDSHDDRTQIIDSLEVLEKMKREAGMKRHLYEDEDIVFLDDEDEFFDEEDNDPEIEKDFLDEEDEPEMEEDDDLLFIDDSFDYDVFRFDRAKKQRLEEEEKERLKEEVQAADDAGTGDSEEQEFYDETPSWKSEEEYIEEETYFDEDDSEEYPDDEYDEEPEESPDYEDEEDDDRTGYIDPDQVNKARVNGFVPVENEPDLDAMSKKEKKKYLKEKKKQEKAQAKEDKKAGKASGEKPALWKRVLKGIAFTLLGAVLAAYVGGAGYFFTHFAPDSVVNGADVSYMNVSQVQDVIREQVKGYSLKVVERKGAEETISGAEVGLEYVPDDQVKSILHAQNCFIWPYRMYKYLMKEPTDLEESFTHASVQLDDTKFKNKVKALNCSDVSQMIAPENSYPNLEGSIYAPHPEEEGTTIKADVLDNVLKEALLSTVPSVDLDANDCYTNPEITSDDPEINRICDKKNELVGLSITYHFGDEVDVLDGATTDSWITWDDDLNGTVDEEKIKEWAVEFGKKHDTVGKPRTFTGAAGREVTVSGGSYGWSVDETQEIDMVKQMFEERKSQDREPIWATTAATHDALDWGNTYIEVDIATQHMWYFRDGELIFENDVVTGLPTPARQTTPGVWSILEMKRNKVLRGTRLSDGSYEYETPVAYWLRVTWTGIGFHDATWQPAFGGSRYTYAGSHGCINMSYSGVQTLYGIAFVGCPVIVHQ